MAVVAAGGTLVCSWGVLPPLPPSPAFSDEKAKLYIKGASHASGLCVQKESGKYSDVAKTRVSDSHMHVQDLLSVKFQLQHMCGNAGWATNVM